MLRIVVSLLCPSCVPQCAHRGVPFCTFCSKMHHSWPYSRPFSVLPMANILNSPVRLTRTRAHARRDQNCSQKTHRRRATDDSQRGIMACF